MPAMTYQDLRPLLDQFADNGPVLSCYADLGVAEGFRHDWRGALKARADALAKAVGHDGRVRQELEENLTAVRGALEAPGLQTAHWAAVFSAARRGFLHVLPLDVPVETDLVLDRSPYLVPLLVAAHRRREYLAVHANTHRGRVYAATPGGVRPLVGVEGEVPRKQHSAGETWGYGQATIARHREDRVLHFRKDLTREVERLWDAGRYAGLMLLGEHEVLAHLRGALPPRVAGRVVREAPEAWADEPERVEEKLRSTAAALYAEDLGEPAAEFWDLLREGKAVAAGPRAVIDAVQGGRLGADGHGYLVLGPDSREVVGRCRACGALAADGPGPCPRCQALCAPGNLWEELLLTALKHRIAARFVADPRKLAPYGGLVAVLPKAASA